MFDFWKDIADATATQAQLIGHSVAVALDNPSLEAKTLAATAILAVFTAFIGMLSYFGKLAVQGILHIREERRKYRSAIIQYVYDADIWVNDFAKNFNRAELEKWLAVAAEGPDGFKLAFSKSKDEDSEALKYIHWLRPREIYSIRLFIACSQSFESICDLASSDTFAKFDRKRKINALIGMYEAGLDAYSYAVQSLEATRRPYPPVFYSVGSYLISSMLRIILPDTRHYLDKQVHLNNTTNDIYDRSDYVPADWKNVSMDQLRKDALEKLEKSSKGRRKGLGHFRFPCFTSATKDK